MSSPKRCADKPATSCSSENDGGMGEGARANIGAIGQELRQAALNKRQSQDGDGGIVVSNGDLGASVAPPRQQWGLLSATDSLPYCSDPLGRAFATARGPFVSSLLDSTRIVGPFGANSFPQVSAARRPHPAPDAQPRHLPTSLTSDQDRCASLGPQFLTIRKGAYVYQTQDWKDMSLSLYSPLEHDLVINTHTVDQLSYESNYFFLADSLGNYTGSSNGHAIHFWQHDYSTKRLYVIQSILFLREQDYNYVMELVKRL